jgi:tetratricopeptide (TPR) repeat protein
MPSRIALALAVALCFVHFAGGDDRREQHHQDEVLGTVHFPNSCSPLSQPELSRGVALLHSFWYEEAQKAFSSAARQDRGCAIAHWGIAMSRYHQLWEHPSADTLRQGWSDVQQAQRIGTKDERERAYISAAAAFYRPGQASYQVRASAYVAAMQRVYAANAGDHEAAVFYALSLLAAAPEHDRDIQNRTQAAAILEKVFQAEPDHPGVAHYLIHAYDTPGMAALGLSAARRYAQIAPSSPHALHMPSHIFTRLGLWQDSINSNLASIAATRRSAEMYMGGSGHQFHAMDFLVYAYLQNGHEADARRVIEEATALAKGETGHWGYVFADFPVRYALELHHWSEAAVLPAPASGAERGDLIYWARAIGAAREAHAAQAERELRQYDAERQRAPGGRKQYKGGDAGPERKEAAAWIVFARGRIDEAITSMRAAAEEEERIGLDSLAIPAREMLADMLLEAKRPQTALAEYQQALRIAPNRFNSVAGAAQAAEQAGDSRQASTYYAQLVNICSGSFSERPELRHARSLMARQ